MAREDSEFMKEISSKNGVGYVDNHEDPAEFSAMAPIEFEGTLNKHEISQATHVTRSVRRWQASHPNLLIRILFHANFMSIKILITFDRSQLNRIARDVEVQKNDFDGDDKDINPEWFEMPIVNLKKCPNRD
ncbi:hypothetical protein ACTXT7_004662 [Hymenolepis weldensis]